jgi:hypothetical protein
MIRDVLGRGDPAGVGRIAGDELVAGPGRRRVVEHGANDGVFLLFAGQDRCHRDDQAREPRRGRVRLVDELLTQTLGAVLPPHSLHVGLPQVGGEAESYSVSRAGL